MRAGLRFFNSYISRWITKSGYWIKEQENYEVNMHNWWELHNDMCRKLLLQEVWRNMKEQGDYANWYYIPYDAGRVRMMNRIREEHYTKTKGSF